MALRIDTGMLLCAISDQTMEFYLDLETGEVIPGGIDEFDEEDEEYQEIAAMDDNPRFLPVERVSSDRAWNWMAQFIEGVEDPLAREVLSRAIQGRGAFRHFKDQLGVFPGLRDAWFAFEMRRQLEVAREWLEAEGIEAVLEPVGGARGQDSSDPVERG
jgi:hypothetical protein